MTTVNIKEIPFGARGDGVVDDTAALQSLISTVATGFSSHVVFPKGTYKITSNITFTIGTSLKFEAGATLQPASGVKIILPPHIEAPLTQQIFDSSQGGNFQFIASGGTFAFIQPTFVSPCWWGAKFDRVTDDTAAWKACVDSITMGYTLLLPPGTSIISDTITFDACNAKFGGASFAYTSGIKVQGSGGNNTGIPGSTVIYSKIQETKSTNLTINATSNANSWAQITGINVTSADDGRYIFINGFANDVNNGRFLIIKTVDRWKPSHVYSTNNVVAPNPSNGFLYTAGNPGTSSAIVANVTTFGIVWPAKAGATVNDNGIIWTASVETPITSCKIYNPSAIVNDTGGYGRIEKVLFDARMRDFIFQNIAMAPYPGAGFSTSYMISFTESAMPGSSVSTAPNMDKVSFFNDLGGGTYKYGLALANMIMPFPGKTSYAESADGTPQPHDPFNCDVGRFKDCEFLYPDTAGVVIHNNTGQSKDHLFSGCSCIFADAFYYVDGIAHSDIYKLDFGQIYCAGAWTNSYTGTQSKFADFYGEDCAMFASLGLNLITPGPSSHINCQIFNEGAYPWLDNYGQGSYFKINGPGPHHIQGCNAANENAGPYRDFSFFSLNGGSQSALHLTIQDCAIPAITKRGSFALQTSTNKGPWKLTDGYTLTAVVSGGATQTVTFHTNQFVDIKQATAREVKLVVDAQLNLAGNECAAFFAPESRSISIRTKKSGSGSITTNQYFGGPQSDAVTLSITGGTAAGIFGFPINVISQGTPPTQLELATNGCIDQGMGTSNNGYISILFTGNVSDKDGNGGISRLDHVVGTFATATDIPSVDLLSPKYKMSYAGGISATMTAPGDTLDLLVPISGSTTSKVIQLSGAEQNADYSIKATVTKIKGTPPIESMHAYITNTSKQSFILNIEGAPGTNNEVTYGLTLLRGPVAPAEVVQNSDMPAGTIAWFNAGYGLDFAGTNAAPPLDAGLLSMGYRAYQWRDRFAGIIIPAVGVDGGGFFCSAGDYYRPNERFANSYPFEYSEINDGYFQTIPPGAALFSGQAFTFIVVIQKFQSSGGFGYYNIPTNRGVEFLIDGSGNRLIVAPGIATVTDTTNVMTTGSPEVWVFQRSGAKGTTCTFSVNGTGHTLNTPTTAFDVSGAQQIVMNAQEMIYDLILINGAPNVSALVTKLKTKYSIP